MRTCAFDQGAWGRHALTVISGVAGMWPGTCRMWLWMSPWQAFPTQTALRGIPGVPWNSPEDEPPFVTGFKAVLHSTVIRDQFVQPSVSDRTPLRTTMKVARRTSEGATAQRPGLPDLSDELLTVVISKLDTLTQKIVFSGVCRRFHGLLFHSKALGDLTLDIDKLGKKNDIDRSMDAVR